MIVPWENGDGISSAASALLGVANKSTAHNQDGFFNAIGTKILHHQGWWKTEV